jgi:phosphotransferase system HPr (HPr) family protein
MNGDTLERKVRIVNPQGFHLRPIAAFAQLAGRFQSDVIVSRDGKDDVNGKSILDLMLLAAPQDSELTLKVTGPDAKSAIEALVTLLQTPPEEGNGTEGTGEKPK